MTKAVCPRCEKETEFRHLHNAPHGIPSAHMSGTERYRCTRCGHVVYKGEGEKMGLKFFLD